MKIYVRNITKNKDMEIELPMNVLKLEEKLGVDEYIIVEAENILPVDAYSSISEINTFLDNCREVGVYEDELAILKHAGYIFEEIRDMIANERYVVIDFTETTRKWSSGDIHSDSDKGLCLHINGYSNLPFKYDDSMEDYINWEVVWTEAESSGWRISHHDSHDYLVRAY